MIVSLADVKSYLNVSDNTHDSFLLSQIRLVTSAIETYCRRRFSLATYIETFYADTSGRVLTTYHFPIVKVLSIASLDGVDIANYRVQKRTGIITGVYGIGCNCITNVDQSIEITYQAGYADLDMPEELKYCVLDFVGIQFNKKTSGVGLAFGNDVQQIAIPGVATITYDYTLTNNDPKTPMGQLLGNYLNILDQFRSDRAIMPSGILEYVEEVI